MYLPIENTCYPELRFWISASGSRDVCLRVLLSHQAAVRTHPVLKYLLPALSGGAGKVVRMTHVEGQPEMRTLPNILRISCKHFIATFLIVDLNSQ